MTYPHSQSRQRPQSHLINIIKETRPHHPNFALFLGAGASVTSGVSATAHMIENWRECAWKNYGERNEEKAKYLERQTWYKHSDEYSVLFELLYDEPSQRREFIEKCIADAKPSWGYIYLVNLIANSVFNTVFTTNFDDLLNEACYQFSNAVRPIVCAHDSSIRSVRITSKRPKIIKLHGDFLFDNIKNTLSELESLEDNMREKFKQYATEFGLIVIGYSGSDRSIMDALTVLLRHEVNFPHGVYWCVRRGSNLSANVENLRRFPKFKLIEIDGFDEFFAEVQESLELKLQPELADPYKALADKFNNLISGARIPAQPNTHRVIEKDIESIAEKIAALANEPNTVDAAQTSHVGIKVGSEIVKFPLPFQLLSQAELRQSHFEAALKYQLLAIDTAPNLANFRQAVAILINKDTEGGEQQLIDRIEKFKVVFLQHPTAINDMVLPLIASGRYVAAEKLLDCAYSFTKTSNFPNLHELYMINRYQIKLHKGETLSKEETENLEKIMTTENDYAKLGATILLRRFSESYQLFDKLVQNGMLKPAEFDKWPIKKLLPERLIDATAIPIPNLLGVVNTAKTEGGT